MTFKYSCQKCNMTVITNKLDMYMDGLCTRHYIEKRGEEAEK